MATHGKRYLAAAATVDRSRTYSSAEACAAVKAAAKAKFNETVDVAVRLGVDPRHADQVVRGTVVLPHGTGKTVRVLVVTQGEKAKEAEAAGATGRVNENRVPFCGSLSTKMRPPCSSTSVLVMARPRPVPPPGAPGP